MLDELDFARPLECDVAIAGAGLAGLVAGAILAKHGRKVVVVDGAPRVGGSAGGTPRDGGQRDGVDVGDLQVAWRYGQLAAQQADVEVPLHVVEPVLRVHHTADASCSGWLHACSPSTGTTVRGW